MPPVPSPAPHVHTPLRAPRIFPHKASIDLLLFVFSGPFLISLRAICPRRHARRSVTVKPRFVIAPRCIAHNITPISRLSLPPRLPGCFTYLRPSLLLTTPIVSILSQCSGFIFSFFGYVARPSTVECSLTACRCCRAAIVSVLGPSLTSQSG